MASLTAAALPRQRETSIRIRTGTSLSLTSRAFSLADRYLNLDTALVVPAVLIVLGGALVVIALGRSRNQ